MGSVLSVDQKQPSVKEIQSMEGTWVQKQEVNLTGNIEFDNK